MDSTENLPSTISTRLSKIRARIDNAARTAGRPTRSVTLVAVSKTYPAEDIVEAISHGQAIFGENRVQEAAAKFAGPRTDNPALRLHLIGPLQTNKARDAVRIADVIETLDRPRIADGIAEAAQREGRMPDLLVQVNVGDEPQKAGVGRPEADGFIYACKVRFGHSLVGLMCIPPADADPSGHFAWLAARARAHGLAIVSMGMSADFEIAIAHGATHVRIGAAIFGRRA